MTIAQSRPRALAGREQIFSLLPRAATNHKLPLMLPSADTKAALCLYANLGSLVLDYAARQKVGGTSLTYFYLKQLPVLPPDVFGDEAEWSDGQSNAEWIVPRLLELAVTSRDLASVTRSAGAAGSAFRWDTGRRDVLRAELDAAFLHLYGLGGEDAEHVLHSFAALRRRETKACGRYVTRDRILERFDALAAATPKRPYRSPLEPGPAADATRHSSRAHAIES